MLERTRLPWRVRALDAFARRWGVPIMALDDDAIEAARGPVSPPRPPVSWLTGAVLPSVHIDTITARVDDDAAGNPPSRESAESGSAPQAREIAIRRYRPRRHLRARLHRSDALPIIVFFHGGGWVLGNVSGYDPLCTYLADSLTVLVASVDYRLAPHHRAPAATDDVLAATLWLWRHAREVGGDPTRMAVCGDSAGGNLATVVAQELRDRAERGEPGPRLRHQALLYPAVDATRLTPSRMARARGPVISRRDTDTYLWHYLGLGQGGLTVFDARVSPALGRLQQLPPTLIQTAEFDPLRDEGLAYGAALAAAGVSVVSTTYAGAVHGFASFPAGAPHGFRHRAELTAEIGRHLLDDLPGPPAPDRRTAR